MVHMGRPSRTTTSLFKAAILSSLCASSSALIASGDPLNPPAPEIMPRPAISIINPLDAAAVEQLPATFVESWPTWILSSEEGAAPSFVKIPHTDGFVNPSSIDQLWQPIDLNYPELRLALGLHVRNGQLRHIMPAVDLSYFDGKHRNRGMCTVPRAHSWLTYVRGMEEWVVRVSSLAKGKQPDSDPWKQLAISVRIGPSLEEGLKALADSPPDELGEGSHIIHIPLSRKDEPGLAVPCPKVEQQLKATLGGSKNAQEAAAAPGILQVVVAATMAGSESEFLPDAYAALYQNPVLRRQAYAKFRARQDKKRDELQKASAQYKATAASVLMDQDDVTEL